ncbi:putative phage protein [Bordetella avium 197N]|uniref:Phage protein n=1 Tax=Bordetella avium (strain 197N) TaxID=360910 RepID=Q2L2H2_BORA1|nr:putative phage protein [Bordetella avium 197N]
MDFVCPKCPGDALLNNDYHYTWEEIRAFLKKRVPNGFRCPVCGSDSWTSVALPRLGPDGLLAPTGGSEIIPQMTLPMFTKEQEESKNISHDLCVLKVMHLSCSNCAHTLLFDLDVYARALAYARSGLDMNEGTPSPKSED